MLSHLSPCVSAGRRCVGCWGEAPSGLGDRRRNRPLACALPSQFPPCQEAEVGQSEGSCGARMGQEGEHCGGAQQETGSVEQPCNRGAGGRSAIRGKAEESKIQGQDSVQGRT